MQKFVRIVESVTKPTSDEGKGKENVERLIDAALEDRKLEYMKRNNIMFGQEVEPEVLQVSTGKKYNVSDIVNDAELSRQMQLERDL